MRKLRIALLLFLGLALAMLFFGRGSGIEIEPGSTLVLELEGSYVEAPAAPIIARLLGEQRRPFISLLSSLRKAERDDRLDRVVVVIRPLGIGWGKAGEVRDAILDLREAGKKTVAYLEMAGFSASREYYVASAADEIYVVPGGAVPVIGLAAEYFFLGGLWEKLGVEFDVGKAGRYKSAVEAYAGTEMSEASEEMANSLLDSTHDAFVDAIAEGRGFERSAVLAAIDQGPMLPFELEALGLIDGSEHLDELLTRLGAVEVTHDEYAAVDPSDVGFDPQARVALIYGSGSVVSGSGRRSVGGEPVFAARSASEAILDAADDPSIDAIILRIDSPGGSSLASEEIWRAVIRARERGKPIVASFSDMAASGGYYVAVAADSIVSGAGTLTGSIGVFALRPVLGGALDKLGIGIESFSRGRYADYLLGSEPLADHTRARLQSLVIETYRLFVERVADGRGLEAEAVDAVAQGRVWTGRQALEAGLVDELGGLHTAVDHVRERLDLAADTDVALVPFPPPLSLSQEIADAIQSRVVAVVQASVPVPAPFDQLRSWMVDLPARSPLLIPPVLVDIR